MNWIIVIAVSLSIIAIWLLSKFFGWCIEVYRIYEYQKLQKRHQAKRDEEYALSQKKYEEYMAERQTKIDLMASKGYESAGNDGYYWIERENGKIKRLYNLEGTRVPLAELSKLSGAKIIGNEPVLYYLSEKITKHQMWNDEAEIRKLNNT
jgi:hypothetical protein